MNLDLPELYKALREIRGGKNTLVILALNAYTYAFWHETLRRFQKEVKVEYLIDHRIESGVIGARLCPDDGPEGEERFFDLREKTRAAR